MQRVDFDLVFKFVTLSWKWILEMFSAYRWWAATCGEEKTRAQWCMRRSNRRHTRFFFRFGFFWLLLFGADGGGTEDVHRFLINATARGFLAANHRLWGIRRAHEGASPALCVWLLPLPTKTIKRLSYNDYTSRYPTQINKVWPPDKIFNSLFWLVFSAKQTRYTYSPTNWSFRALNVQGLDSMFT